MIIDKEAIEAGTLSPYRLLLKLNYDLNVQGVSHTDRIITCSKWYEKALLDSKDLKMYFEFNNANPNAVAEGKIGCLVGFNLFQDRDGTLADNEILLEHK